MYRRRKLFCSRHPAAPSKSPEWLWSFLAVSMGTYILVDSSGSMSRMSSFGGVFLCILAGYACSKHRKEIAWSTVLAVLGVQFLCGLLVTRWMSRVFKCAAFRVQMAINSTFKGSSFIFGYLDNGQLVGLPNQQPVFAFHHLPVVLFFSFLVSVMHYCGATQFVAVNLGKLLHMATCISAPECIFSMATVVVNLVRVTLTQVLCNVVYLNGTSLYIYHAARRRI
ncbi:sodium/nucleoside cotransporter 2-like [Haemaphysalis longicornis]